MSRCGKTQHLEAVALGEAPASVRAEIRAHAKDCALCRHELNWLESEAAIFRNHAGRDEVAHLWAGVAQRRGLAAPVRHWPRVLVALAAAAALVLLAPLSSSSQRSPSQAEALESSPLMSPVLFFGDEAEAEAPACSTLPSGVGFQCSPAVPASFLASR